MRSAGVSCNEFSVTPFPIESPDVLANYAPMSAVYYLTIYDSWGEEKLRRLTERGLCVEVLWKSDDKKISGTQIRSAMRAGRPWQHQVPDATAQYLINSGLLERICGLKPDDPEGQARYDEENIPSYP